MKTPKIKELTSDAQKFIVRNSPKILIGLGIAGMITSTVLAVDATPKALKLIEEAEDQKMEDQLNDGVKPTEIVETLTPVETVKATWKVYIPAMSVGFISIICLIASANISSKRVAALTATCQLSEAALMRYKDAVIETIGEKKAKEVKEKVADKQMESNKPVDAQVIITDTGTALCLDTLSGRYFRSDINTLRKAENELNRELQTDDYVSLNSYYDMINLPQTKLGDELGWSIDAGGAVNLEIFAKIAEDGQPCLVIEYSSLPQYEYWKL